MLPNCCILKIRTAYQDLQGNYRGFIEGTDKDRCDEPDALNQREDSSLHRGVERKFYKSCIHFEWI